MKKTRIIPKEDWITFEHISRGLTYSFYTLKKFLHIATRLQYFRTERSIILICNLKRNSGRLLKKNCAKVLIDQMYRTFWTKYNRDPFRSVDLLIFEGFLQHIINYQFNKKNQYIPVDGNGICNHLLHLVDKPKYEPLYNLIFSYNPNNPIEFGDTHWFENA